MFQCRKGQKDSGTDATEQQIIYITYMNVKELHQLILYSHHLKMFYK